MRRESTRHAIAHPAAAGTKRYVWPDYSDGLHSPPRRKNATVAIQRFPRGVPPTTTVVLNRSALPPRSRPSLKGWVRPVDNYTNPPSWAIPRARLHAHGLTGFKHQNWTRPSVRNCILTNDFRQARNQETIVGDCDASLPAGPVPATGITGGRPPARERVLQATEPCWIRTSDQGIMSRAKGGSEATFEDAGTQEPSPASERTEAQKSPENKGDSAPGQGAKRSARVTASVLEASDDRRRSDKQNDKRASADPDLAKVISAWPDLPGPTKAAVLAVIDSATNAKGKSARRGKD